MKHRLLALLRRWVFRVNRTLLLEVLVLMALGLLGLAVVWPAVQWATPSGLRPVAAGVLMTIAVAMVLAGLWVVHSRWMNATRLVRSLDRFYQTEQLLETGLGVAHGWAVGSDALTQDVRERALLAARRVNLTKWRPMRIRGWVAGLVWVAVGLMVNLMVAVVRIAPGSTPARVPQAQLQQPTLPKQAQLDLYAQADALQRLTADPSLTNAASSALRRSAQALREAALSETSQNALAQRLARANDSLDQLLHLAGAQQLVSPGALRALSHQELASTLRSALEQGDLGAIERAASDLQRRLNRSSPLKARGIGQSLTDALAGPLVGQPNAPTNAPLNPDTLEQVANSMEQVANQLAAGNQALAQSTLGDALAQLREADQAPSIVEHHANQARNTVASAQQAMADAKQRRSNPDPTPSGASLQAAANPSDNAVPKGAQSAAKAGPGRSLGNRGTPMGTQLLDEGEGGRRPGAQAAAGDATGQTGEAGVGPNGPTDTAYPSWPVRNPLNPSAAWVQSVWQGAQGGVVRAAQGGSMPTAGRATWQQVHTHYRSIAESAMHQEAIPLSRQDTVRAYFLAIRPPLNDRAQDRP